MSRSAVVLRLAASFVQPLSNSCEPSTFRSDLDTILDFGLVCQGVLRIFIVQGARAINSEVIMNCPRNVMLILDLVVWDIGNYWVVYQEIIPMKRSTWVDVESGGRLGCNGEIFWSECAECDCSYCNPNYVCVCSEKVYLHWQNHQLSATYKHSLHYYYCKQRRISKILWFT